MNLFNRGKAKKKWHRKAWLVDPNRTKIVLVATASPRPIHVPPWIYKKELDQSTKELFMMSNIRKEYCGSLGCPDNYANLQDNARETALPF